MILSEVQRDELLDAARPLIKWLNDNCHPHVEARVTLDSVTCSEQVAREITNEFIKS